jgi:hypothetical protein
MKRSALAAILILALLTLKTAGADLVIGGDPRVDAADFRITTFASGLNYPLGMAQLADGSIMVAVSNGSGYSSRRYSALGAATLTTSE